MKFSGENVSKILKGKPESGKKIKKNVRHTFRLKLSLEPTCRLSNCMLKEHMKAYKLTRAEGSSVTQQGSSIWYPVGSLTPWSELLFFSR